MTTARNIYPKTIDYRAGEIEITPDIHPNCINIESWEIKDDVDETIYNTELELTVEEAKQMIEYLQEAIQYIENKKDM